MRKDLVSNRPMRESIGARTALTRGATLSDDAGSFKHNADIVWGPVGRVRSLGCEDLAG